MAAVAVVVAVVEAAAAVAVVATQVAVRASPVVTANASRQQVAGVPIRRKRDVVVL
jgi:hypothetical protein